MGVDCQGNIVLHRADGSAEVGEALRLYMDFVLKRVS